jgi:hypothetical protein
MELLLLAVTVAVLNSGGVQVAAVQGDQIPKQLADCPGSRRSDSEATGRLPRDTQLRFL